MVGQKSWEGQSAGRRESSRRVGRRVKTERWTGGLPGFQGTFNSCFQALRLVGLRFRAPIHLIPFFLLSEPAWLKALVALTLTLTVPSRHSPTGALGFAPHGGLLRSRAGHFVHNVLPNFKSRLVNPFAILQKVSAPLWSLCWITSGLCLHLAPIYANHYTFLLHCFQGHLLLRITNPWSTSTWHSGCFSTEIQ